MNWLKSLSDRGSFEISTPDRNVSKQKKKGLFDDIPLKVGKLLQESVEPNMDYRMGSELRNPMMKNLVTKPLWRESVRSLRSIDLNNVYRVRRKSFFKINFCQKLRKKLS